VDKFEERRTKIFKYIEEHPDTPFLILNKMFNCDIRKLLKRHKPELYVDMVQRGLGKKPKTPKEKSKQFRKCLKCGRVIIKPAWLCDVCRKNNKQIDYETYHVYL